MSTAYERVKAWRQRPESKAKRAEEARRYRAKHPEEVKAVKQAYRERSKDERLPREAEIARQRRAADPEGQRRRNEEYRQRRLARLDELAGRPRPDFCELCGEHGKTVFDHCHVRGHFRGWLCDRCNRTLGQVKDDIQLLLRMATYLERSHEQPLDESAQRTSVVCFRTTEVAEVPHE